MKIEYRDNEGIKAKEIIESYDRFDLYQIYKVVMVIENEERVKKYIPLYKECFWKDHTVEDSLPKPRYLPRDKINYNFNRFGSLNS